MVADCTERVNRGDYRCSIYQPCGRPAVEDGLCKLHLRVRDRREAKSREWEEENERGNQLCDEAKALSKALGIDIQAYFNVFGKSGYTGDFVVPGDWLRKIMEAHGG